MFIKKEFSSNLIYSPKFQKKEPNISQILNIGFELKSPETRTKEENLVLFHKNKGLAYSFANRYFYPYIKKFNLMKNQDAFEDALSSALEGLWMAIQTWDREKSSLSTWTSYYAKRKLFGARTCKKIIPTSAFSQITVYDEEKEHDTIEQILEDRKTIRPDKKSEESFTVQECLKLVKKNFSEKHYKLICALLKGEKVESIRLSQYGGKISRQRLHQMIGDMRKVLQPYLKELLKNN
jgi:DNA-directed RNA polymerase specialized sigma subunit